MVDPVSSKAIASAAQPDAAEKLDEASKTEGPDGASFQEVLEGQDAEGGQDPSSVDGAQDVDPTQKVQGTEKPMEARLDKFVSGVLDDEKALDDMMSKAMNGADLDNTELLKLQGLMYSYTQKVDLATKVVSKATEGMKQLMNTQV